MSKFTVINQLRFIERDGKRILQQQPAVVNVVYGSISIEVGEWENVPMIVPTELAT